MKRLPFLFLLPVLFFSTSCELSTTSADEYLSELEADLNDAGISTEDLEQEIDDAVNPAPESQAPVPVTSPGTIPTGICCGFLWKPISESTGGLVILTPPETQGRTQQIATISGAFGTESAPMRHETHNGGRPHFYFDKPGAAYGTNITVQVPLIDGSVYSVVIPNGALRWE